MRGVNIILFIVILLSCFIYADSGGESIAEPFFFDTGWIYNQRVGHFHFPVEDEGGFFTKESDLLPANAELRTCGKGDSIAYIFEDAIPENEPLKEGFVKGDLLFTYMREIVAFESGLSEKELCGEGSDKLVYYYDTSEIEEGGLDGEGRFDFFIAEGTSIPDIEIVSCVASGGIDFVLSRDMVFNESFFIDEENLSYFNNKELEPQINSFYDSNSCPLAVFTADKDKYFSLCSSTKIIEYPLKNEKVNGDYHLFLKVNSKEINFNKGYARCLLKVVNAQENSVENGMPLINFRAHGSFDDDSSMNKAVSEWNGTDVKIGTKVTSENYPGSHAGYFNRKFLFRKEGEKVLEPSEEEYESFALSEEGDTKWIDGVWYPRNLKTSSQLSLGIQSNFDWRYVNGTNWMTSVKNQGWCGSCWAFSALGAMEASYNVQIKNPDLDLDLSEQELVSNCFEYGSCLGTIFVFFVFDYLKDVGIAIEECDPYKMHNTFDCIGQDCFIRYNLKEVFYFQEREDIQKYLKERGPISTCFKLAEDYIDEKGILRCNEDLPAHTNHCITISGYDDEDEYWIFKNSWGLDWGDNGYGKIGYGECDLMGSSEEFMPASLLINNL